MGGNDVIERLMRRSVINSETGCINWTGCTVRGYGQIAINRKTFQVHTLAWESHNGPLPQGMELDHRCHSDAPCGRGHGCRHRSCWNVAHLELVTHRVNLVRGESPVGVNARKMHCIRGHEFSDSNTRIDSKGGRVCRICHNARNRASKERRSAIATEVRP